MKKAQNMLAKKEKAFLVGIILDNREDIDVKLEELERLAETAGLEVVGKDYQYVREINPATILGSGKLEEIKAEIEQTDTDVVIVDFKITGSQSNNISNALDIKVLDRMALILDIFAMRASSNEGRLQVKLAQLKYTLPRLSSIAGTSGRFGSGGVGMRGPGETKLETNRRIVENDIDRLNKEIKKIKEQEVLKRKNRDAGNKKQIAIVGYTNAGKSTFLNLISKAGIYADDKLFATLDTTSRNVWLAENLQVILTDTVGFINDLPHELIDAFSSTLEEAKNADLILHVVDISNPHYKTQMNTVNETLQKIHANNIPQIILYNKVDKIPATPFIALKDNELLISAKKNIGIDELKQKIIEFFTN